MYKTGVSEIISKGQSSISSTKKLVKKILLLILLFQTSVFSQDLEKAYFAGGCFWCMEESFESAEGVSEVISGYSGGITENPTIQYVSNRCIKQEYQRLFQKANPVFPVLKN